MLGLGIARGMFTTLWHMVAVKPVTIQYPEQKMDMPAWTRGRPRLIYDINVGDLRCTACGACAIACPVDVIKIEQHAGPDRKKVLDRFDLDMGGCIECALCVEACPFRAIVMAPDFEMATYDRQRSLVFNMHELRIAGTEEVDSAMEYIQGVKRGLAGQAAREAPAASAARPAGAGARPAAAGARPAPAGASAARPAPARPAAPRPAPAAPAAPAADEVPVAETAAPEAPAPRAAQPAAPARRSPPVDAGEKPEGGPPKPPPQTGPRPMTATRLRMLAARGEKPPEGEEGTSSDA
jgi:NADH-quinone oxidoreductase subunit I